MKKLLLTLYLFVKTQKHRLLTFFLPMAIMWVLLESPIIYSIILYIFTHDKRYIAIALSWWAFTAPPLPIPVAPISIGTGVLFERILRKKKRVV